MRRLLALALFLGACASDRTADRYKAAESEPVPAESELEAARRELLRDEKALAGPQADGRPVDCPRATQLGDNVCLLAERICALVTRLPADAAKTAQCTDARARCQAARERVKAACKK
jgi:hypothetical protein